MERAWSGKLTQGSRKRSAVPGYLALTLLAPNWAHGIGHVECGSEKKKSQCLEPFHYVRMYRLWKYCMEGNDRCVRRRAVVQQDLNFPGLVTANLIPTYHQGCSPLMQHCMLTSVCTSACNSHMVHPWPTRGLFLTQERGREGSSGVEYCQSVPNLKCLRWHLARTL